MIFNLCFLDMRTRSFKAILIQRQKGNICELFICYWSLFQTQLDILGRVGTIVDLLLLDESLPEVLGVFELPVGIRALEVEPKQLSYSIDTSSTLQFILGTSSLADFSLRQVRKFLLRKPHSILHLIIVTRFGWEVHIWRPFCLLYIITNDSNKSIILFCFLENIKF